MTTTPTITATDYAIGYAQGRHAAKERVSAKHNPYPRGTSGFHGWNDGHYDEQSARSIEIERHSALIWNNSNGSN